MQRRKLIRFQSRLKAESKSEAKPELKSETLKTEPKSEGSKSFESPKNESPKNPVEDQKKLNESIQHNFESQKILFGQQVAALSLPPPERPQSQTTKLDQVSVVPSRPEFQRTSVSDVVPSKIERNLIPNTVEYGREFVNNRDTRQLFKPSLETTFQKPLDPVSVKPEVMQPFHQVSSKLQPLQGLAEPFTFKPLKPINRADIIEQIGESKTKLGSVLGSIAALILATRRTDKLEPQIPNSKAIDSVIKRGLEPELKASLRRMEPQPQKDKLIEIATKVKENKAENLSPKDEAIAKRIRQLEPKQVEALIAWAQGKLPINFEGIHKDFQTKLSSIFDTVVKATKAESTIVDAKPVKLAEIPVSDKPEKANESKPTEKTVLIDKNTELTDKTSPIAPLIQLKGARKIESEEFTEVQAVQQNADDTKFVEDESAPESDETVKAAVGPIKRNRKTKQMVEAKDSVKDSSTSSAEHIPSRTTLLSNTVKRTEQGTLADEHYNIVLETLYQGKWRKALECTAKDDEALYIQHYLAKPSFKQAITVKSKIAEIVQNNSWHALAFAFKQCNIPILSFYKPEDFLASL